jgi:rare lipoprotein A (peptidoglycan hydrolase)
VSGAHVNAFVDIIGIIIVNFKHFYLSTLPRWLGEMRLVHRFIIIAVLLLTCGCATQSATLKHHQRGSYTIKGKTYYPVKKVSVGYSQDGLASWYGPGFHGRRTASGETYDMHALTAAHSTLPMNTIVRVTNLKNKKDVVVRINDRGPFVGDRVLDLSLAAARTLGMVRPGTAPVRISVVGSGRPRLAMKASGTMHEQKGRSAPNPFFSGSRSFMLAFSRN